jgi:hypothetical protein
LGIAPTRRPPSPPPSSKALHRCIPSRNNKSQFEKQNDSEPLHPTSESSRTFTRRTRLILRSPSRTSPRCAFATRRHSGMPPIQVRFCFCRQQPARSRRRVAARSGASIWNLHPPPARRTDACQHRPAPVGDWCRCQTITHKWYLTPNKTVPPPRRFW